MMATETTKKFEALKTFLETEGNPVSENETAENTYNGDSFEVGGIEYKVLTDDEAYEAARYEILNSLWAFNADFIIEHTEFYNECTAREAEEATEALALLSSKLCESANPIVKALIRDLDKFVDDAIDADGRGHFISWYDGEENESGDYYIYRIN